MGERLRHCLARAVIDARLQRGWTQAVLALQAGTKQSRISEIETARGNPRFTTIEKVVLALGLQIEFAPRHDGDLTR